MVLLRKIFPQKTYLNSAVYRNVSYNMKLDRARQLINEGIDRNNPMGSLIHILESAIELVSLPDNDFCWSYWENGEEAKQEILA